MSEWKEALLERDTPIVWPAIDCGDGWRPLVEFLYDECERLGLKVAQVKEKFGQLRFYVDGDMEPNAKVDEFYQIASVVQQISARICEQCGAHGGPRGGGWIKTLCDDHAAKRETRDAG